MKIVGLMSGTSADGIDAALVEVNGTPEALSWQVLGFVEIPFPVSVREEILRLCDAQTGRVDHVCAMNVALGEWFAEAVIEVCRVANIPLVDVDAIGSHGQTIHHLPDSQIVSEKLVRATLQIGDPAVIAERTGITTVSDFRMRDMAVGGQGAPLVPLIDYLLFRSADKGRVLLNIGGIANVTVLPKSCGIEEVFAFDTGPGNMVIDGVVGAVTQGEMTYDKDGAIAQQGTPLQAVIDGLMDLDFFKKQPPKSTGRELFGDAMVQKMIRASDSAEDLVATATAWTATSIADALDRFVTPRCKIDELVVSGGGAKNPELMAFLKEMLPCKVLSSNDFGMQSEAKEAVAFALLAHETLNGRYGNVSGVTGASRRVVLGSITPGHQPISI
ncbi:MAG: anhydro-N-acetylmuramic acid kinase [Candidatus Latescibacteria bacterium]|jgi:anhydro-N-acetylmuramic acid kinase|nr:anhydro-N-acetylmuramic acid kinase [Candidatus Latescibacterota bacterium]